MAATGPVVTCPADQTVDADNAASMTVTAVSPGRTITSYGWTVMSGPTMEPNSWTWNPTGMNAATETFAPGVVGTYTIRVQVTDSAGATGSCTTHVTAMSHGLRLEVTWDGTGDLDLHLHNGVTTSPWFSTPNDLYYANLNPAWGGVFDLDSITGYGPELAHHNAPTIGESYTLAVHNYGSGAGRIATARIYCGRTTTPTMTYTSRPLTGTGSGMTSTNDFWKVARIQFSTASACTVTPVDTYVTSMAATTAF